MADQQPSEVIIPIERNSSPQPPQTIAPTQTPANNPAQNDAVFMPPTIPPTPQYPPQAVSTPTPSLPNPFSQPAPANPTFYNPSQQAPSDPQPSQGIAWRSLEYIAHDKDASWYGAMALGSAIISGIVYLLNRDVVTSAIILFALIGLAYFSGRKPHDQQFEVSRDGVHVGRSFYAFHEFRSFSLTEDRAATSVVLIPLKRFMPAVNIYVPAEFKEQVVNVVASVLPFEQQKTDFVESLMQRIRF